MSPAEFVAELRSIAVGTLKDAARIDRKYDVISCDCGTQKTLVNKRHHAKRLICTGSCRS